jgi:hypothetical protein
METFGRLSSSYFVLSYQYISRYGISVVFFDATLMGYLTSPLAHHNVLNTNSINMVFHVTIETITLLIVSLSL